MVTWFFLAPFGAAGGNRFSYRLYWFPLAPALGSLFSWSSPPSSLAPDPPLLACLLSLLMSLFKCSAVLSCNGNSTARFFLVYFSILLTTFWTNFRLSRELMSYETVACFWSATAKCSFKALTIKVKFLTLNHHLSLASTTFSSLFISYFAPSTLKYYLCCCMLAIDW